jgi:hypothetical protein
MTSIAFFLSTVFPFSDGIALIMCSPALLSSPSLSSFIALFNKRMPLDAASQCDKAF